MNKIDKICDEDRRELPMAEPSLSVQTPAQKPLRSSMLSTEILKMEAEMVLVGPLRTRKSTRNTDRHSRDLILKLIRWFEDNQ